jgi:NAD(P)-dependent dehydrogenase (short-subunit alcohol dehydrogenase family)
MTNGSETSRAQRVVLVTGASRGLGREMACQYAGDGWRVIAACRAPDTAPRHVRITALPLDAGDQRSITALAETLRGETIDILVNNAAIRGNTEGLEHLDTSEFLEVTRINCLGPMLMVRAFLPQLRRAPQAVVANISSRVGTVAGLDADGDYAYRCSKAALNMATAKLAFDHDLIFLALHPGWVQTDMGGPDAPVSLEASAAGLRAVIAGASRADSGSFKTYRGEDLPW